MYHVHSYLSISQRPNVVTGNSSVSVFPTFSSLYTNCVCLKNVHITFGGGYLFLFLILKHRYHLLQRLVV